MMRGPSTVSTDSAWNCIEAKPGPRSAFTSPVSWSRLTSTAPIPSTVRSLTALCTANVL